VLYVASANAPKKPDTSAELSLSSLSEEDPFSAYDYTPSLGEKQGPLLRPRIFLLRFNSRSSGRAELSSLQLPDDAWGAADQGQAIFAGDHVACTAYESLKDGRKLGVVYCTNRPSTVLRVPLPSASSPSDDEKKENSKPGQPRNAAWKLEAEQVQRISQEGWSGRSPRWDASGPGVLYWLENERQGAHNDCSRLLKREASAAGQTLVDVIESPDSDEAFPGLYLGDLPARFALSDGALAFSSIWGSRRVPLLVTREGKVVDLAPAKDSSASWGVLATDGAQRILATRSTVGEPPRLMLGTLQSDKTCTWSELWNSAEDAADTAGACRPLRRPGQP
jgi:acylaminoacyl-peptidase